MIIVEGMDNSGKTTLIKSLTRDLPLSIIKSPGPKDSLASFLWVIQTLREKKKDIIYDRYFLISERVYGPIIRGEDVFGDYTFDLISLMLRKSPLIIYCRPSDETIKNWGSRDQMAGVKNNFHDLVTRYDWIMSLIEEIACNSTLIHPYDYTHPMAYSTVKSVVKTYLKENNCG